ncbi:MAG TPA: hypothetical protein DCM40_21830 [Maribacter sp.]|nr:hypothetical protein [Maribacter sp.]
MSKPRKKFGQTTVGKLLKASVGLINPTLGSLIQGDMSVEQVVSSIKNSDAPAEDKIRAQEMVLEAYEAEVADRASARQREMAALASGSNDILFKTVGWGITLCFIGVIAGAVGLWEIPKESQRLFDMGFGAVVAAFTQVIGYYFGSSQGSKQKTELMKKDGEII